KYKDHEGTVKAKEEVKEESKEEFEEETKEEEEDNLEYFNSAKIRTGNMENRKIECMVGQFLKKQAYIDLESPRNFTYKCDFVVLEDTTSVTGHYLGGMVLGKPFVKETRHVYNKDERTVKFEKYREKIIFKTPNKMEMFKHIEKDILKTDNIPSFIITGQDFNQEKTHYLDSLNLGPAYQRDESTTKAIQSLIKVLCLGSCKTLCGLQRTHQVFGAVEWGIVRKNDEHEEEEIMNPNAAKGDDHGITVETEEEVREESKESNEETVGETEEEEEDDLEYFDTFPKVEEIGYHEWLLENPRPP
nr:hypothetical protein [Tanacetum cinerariifolium]